MSDVKTITTTNQSVLLEWTDEESNLNRGWFPLNYLDGLHDLGMDLGIPYGLDWSNHIIINSVTPQQVEQELYKHNIWTAEDALSKPDVVQSIIRKLIGLDVSQIFKVANQVRKGEK